MRREFAVNYACHRYLCTGVFVDHDCNCGCIIGKPSQLHGTNNSFQEGPDQIEEMPLDAFGYLGGLFESRFYEPHSTTGDPHDEIRQAASLYDVDLAMMMSIAKVESNFNPRARTGSYKGLFQLSDDEFEKYGDGSIWDARDNARAAAHMFLVQAEKFKWALGHYPDYAERYMVHQQGILGAIEHYTHPERVAWQAMCATDEGVLKGEQWCRKCIWRNLLPQWKRSFGSVEKISSGDFVSLWTGRINHLAKRYSVAEGGVLPSPHPKSRVSPRVMRAERIRTRKRSKSSDQISFWIDPRSHALAR